MDSAGDLWRRNEIESPCVKICVIHPQAGICAGCYRTRDEIAAWSALSPQARRAVMADLPARAGLLKTRRGGRAARLAATGGADPQPGADGPAEG